MNIGWLPLSLLGVLVWGEWLIRQLFGRAYRPARDPHHETTSLVVPVYREDASVLEQSLATWLKNEPNEILLVIDHSEHELIGRAREWERREPRVRAIVVEPPGKRHALCVGVRAASADVAVLTDSDTFWADDFLVELVRGFADPEVGGVGCRQNVLQAETSLWRRIADWMLDVRFLHYLPCMARTKAIPCISGRTAAYRRAVILPLLDELEHETFFGKQCVSGDDGRLTWLIMREGYKAAYQSSARAWTVFPNNFRGFVKQRVRWSRNSYRCYFRAIWKGWLWKQPLLTPVSVVQNLVGPFTLLVPVSLTVRELAAGHLALAGAVSCWLVLGRGIKGFRHLLSSPRSLLLLPLMTLLVVFLIIPIKLWALLTLNKQGWVTRTEEEAVAEGQGSETLVLNLGLRLESEASR
jgi:cellulose synthase/poly-beta-1,6-N-acetylglucosamine synthase-like glycosyltransferase